MQALKVVRSPRQQSMDEFLQDAGDFGRYPMLDGVSIRAWDPIPQCVRHDPFITPAYLVVYAELVSRRDYGTNLVREVDIGGIAEAAGVNRHTAGDALKILEARKHIEWKAMLGHRVCKLLGEVFRKKKGDVNGE